MLKKKYMSYLHFVECLENIKEKNTPFRIEDDHIIMDDPKDGPSRCRLPLILREQEFRTLDQIQEAVDEPLSYAMILIQAGRASVAIAAADEIVCSKQIQKYMVRKSQGKSQLTYLNEKGKSRLGSRIRLRQSDEFFDEINEKLKHWSSLYQISQIFLSCTPKLKGLWFQSSPPPPFAKSDPRWRRIPFMVRPPGQLEMFRIQKLLCRAEWVGA